MGNDRESFQRWYDAQPDGRLEPFDVWTAAIAYAAPTQAATGDAVRESMEKALETLTLVRSFMPRDNDKLMDIWRRVERADAGLRAVLSSLPAGINKEPRK